MTQESTVKVLIMGTDGMYGAWGSGETEDEARRNFKRQRGLLSKGYSVVTFPEGCEFLGVNNMGAVRYKGTEPTSRDVPARR